jgi:hypothetical protein
MSQVDVIMEISSLDRGRLDKSGKQKTRFLSESGFQINRCKYSGYVVPVTPPFSIVLLPWRQTGQYESRPVPFISMGLLPAKSIAAGTASQ